MSKFGNLVERVLGKKGSNIPMTDAISYSAISGVYYNDAITLIDQCCRCCTNSKPAASTASASEYIRKRINMHHESILEHSNIVIKIEADAISADNYFAIIDNLQYIRVVKDQKFLYFAASIRGWKEFFKHADIEHPTIMQLFTEFSLVCPKCTCQDLIDDEYCDEFNFPDFVPDPNFVDNVFNENWELNENTDIISYLHPVPSILPEDEEQNIDIINIDDITIDNLNYEWIDASDDRPVSGKYFSEINPYDFLQLGTITVCFKNMSRAATHQLVRHRNAITQESQRYVNYGESSFYLPEKAYGAKIGSYPNWESYYKACVDAYNQAVESGIKKEDARYLLPNATECGKLYMTFTWKSLAKFLQLRMDKAAQAEIKNFAIALYESVKTCMSDKLSYWNMDFDTVIKNIDSWYIEKSEVMFDDYCDESCDETLSDDNDDLIGTLID